MSYEILAQKEEFRTYENNIIKMFKAYIDNYCNGKGGGDSEFLKGKIEGIKESLMLNVLKIEDEAVRKKLKEILKKKIVGIELDAFLND
jgi:hypothetical protein